MSKILLEYSLFGDYVYTKIFFTLLFVIELLILK